MWRGVTCGKTRAEHADPLVIHTFTPPATEERCADCGLFGDEHYPYGHPT
jgi:hypothetical protein